MQSEKNRHLNYTIDANKTLGDYKKAKKYNQVHFCDFNIYIETKFLF